MAGRQAVRLYQRVQYVVISVKQFAVVPARCRVLSLVGLRETRRHQLQVLLTLVLHNKSLRVR